MTDAVNQGTATRGAANTGEFLCVLCPNGCLIEAEFTEERPQKLKSFTGNRCKRGEAWVKQEIENPMRTIATSLPVRGGDFESVSARTVRAIPREKIHEVMDAVRAAGVLSAPVHIGTVLLKNPAGTDTEIIATREVRKAG